MAKRRFFLSVAFVAIFSIQTAAQGPRGGDIGQSQLKPGDAGIAWYTTWETGLAEAKRSGRPIMFMAAATQCNGVSGVF